MRTVLVLAPTPELGETLRAGLSPDQYKLIQRSSLEEAEPLVVHSLVDAVVLELGPVISQGLWPLEKLRRQAPKCPVVVYGEPSQTDWEEEAYLKGAAHVLHKPVRVRMLATVLERLWQAPQKAGDTTFFQPQAQVQKPLAEAGDPAPSATAQTLTVLRSFSGILTHSLNAEGMLRQFLLLLREILSINRAAIFLRQPLASVGSAVASDSRRLRAVSSVGIPSSLLEHFELSFEAGIGSHLFRHGRILRRTSEGAAADLEAQKEFELLGTEVAVPILDREVVVGVALFDGRITGEPLVNTELQLVFHLLEQLGLAIKNIWLHDQLATNHEMMTGIMRELASACIVVGRDLAILHANKMARRYFAPAERRGADLEFADLPQLLGTRVYQVLKTGSAIINFRFEPETARGTAYNVSVVPFQRQSDGMPASALLMAEDLTQAEQIRRLELEAANLRLVETMAERLTNEIGNALVPLTVHQQLLSEKLAEKKVNAEFLTMLDRDLCESLRRVGRSNNQMRFLARHTLASEEAFPLAPLLEEAYVEARKYQAGKATEMKCDTGARPIFISGDRAALKHAFAELMLNGLQSNPDNPKIEVRLEPEAVANGNGSLGVQLEIQDNGPGFTPEAAEKAGEPFFKTKVVGLGLGLAVSRKIIEMHRGRLEIVKAGSGQPGRVRVRLPMQAKATDAA